MEGLHTFSAWYIQTEKIQMDSGQVNVETILRNSYTRWFDAGIYTKILFDTWYLVRTGTVVLEIFRRSLKGKFSAKLDIASSSSSKYRDPVNLPS